MTDILGASEQRGDAYLDEGQWQDALTAYAECTNETLRLVERRAWCLCQLERWDEARDLLSRFEPSLSSSLLAYLGVARAGGWSKRYSLSAELKMEVDATIRSALARSNPPATWAYTVFFEFCRCLDATDADKIASSAVEHYPTSSYFRLEWARHSRHHRTHSDIYAGLMKCLSDRCDDEYLWTCTTTAVRDNKWTDAAQHSATLVERHKDPQSDRSTQTILSLIDAWILLEKGDFDSARQRYDDLAAKATALDVYQQIDLRRHYVNLARCEKNENALREAVSSLIEFWIGQKSDVDTSRFLSADCDLLSFEDGTQGLCDIGPTLFHFKDELLGLVEGEHKGVLRYMFALAKHSRDHDDDVDAYAIEVFQAHQESKNVVIAGAVAHAHIVKSNPDWKVAGVLWTRYAHSQLVIGSPVVGDEPLAMVESITKTDLRAYAQGMLSEMEATTPTEFQYEIFASHVRSALVDQKLYELFKRLSHWCAKGSTAINVLFDAGLGAQWCNKETEAVTFYERVLDRSSEHYSALFNLLLLCRHARMRATVERVATFIEAFPNERAEDKQKLRRALESARQACRDPDEEKRNAIHLELARFPSLIQKAPAPGHLSLEMAVTLVTLFRACNSPEGSVLLEPFGEMYPPFSPTSLHRRGLFGLLHAGLISISDDTPLNAFVVENEKVGAFRLGDIRWRVSPATMALVSKIEESAGKKVWPKRWSEAVLAFTQGVAEEECIQYIHHAAEVRGWPPPDDDEKVKALAKGLIQHASVGEAFYLVYLGAMAAADYKAQKPINSQQAANAIVLRTSQRLDRSKATPSWELKSFSRTKEVPRSLLSSVLHDVFLKVGDRAFHERIDRLPLPGFKGKSSVETAAP